MDKYTEALELTGLGSEDQAALYVNRSVAYLKLHDNNPQSAVASEESSTHLEDFRYKALYDAKQAINLWPTWWRAYYRAGCAYTALNKMEKAIDVLDRALALEPVNQDVQDARDYARMKLGQQDRSEHLDHRSIEVPDKGQGRLWDKSSFDVQSTVMGMLKDEGTGLGNIVQDLIEAENYRYGMNGYPVDYNLAAKYYEKAANADNPYGLYNLAVLTAEGKGVQRDIPKAITLLKQAAGKTMSGNSSSIKNIGIAESQHALGVFHEDGVGVLRSPSIAAFWYEKASENGSAEAAHNLGLLYMAGKGVDRNIVTGKEYLKLAASRGAPNAMLSLAWDYASNGDVRNARTMYKRAVDNGSGHAALIREAFEALVNETERKIELVSEWETANGLHSDGMTLEDRMLRKSNWDKSGGLQWFEKDILDITAQLSSPTSPLSKFGLRPRFDYHQILLHASRGSGMAQIMLSAKESFLRALAIVIQMDVYDGLQDEDLDAEYVRCFAHAVRTEGIVIDVMLELTNNMLTVINRVLAKEGSSKSQLDIDARYCFAWFNCTSYKATASFLKECSGKYPNEIGFHKMCAAMFSFQKRFEEGLQELDAVLKLSSEPPFDIWFDRASCMRLLPELVDPQKAIDEYLKFLRAAPTDHRHVPEAYYCMAYLHVMKRDSTRQGLSATLHEEIPPETRECYEKGLEMEKMQLPFFLPYETANKLLVEHLILNDNVVRHGCSSKVQSSDAPVATEEDKEPKVEAKSLSRKEILRSPLRIQIIREVREYYNRRNSLSASMPFKTQTSVMPKKRQKIPKSVANLKTITFRDMDPTFDHVYEGYVIKIKMIEEALTGGPSIITIIEDDNGDVHRCCIYNFVSEMNNAKVQETFGIGCTMNLLNPFMRVAFDGKPAIRVDDPNTLINFDQGGPPKDVCRFCLTRDAKHVCGRCKKARYCCRECQVDDWKLYKHKLVCVKLT